MKHIDFNNECWICGIPEKYNVCTSCGTDVFIADYDMEGGANRIIHHLKLTDIERYNQMVKQAEKENT